jgi:Cof subfamily protein (haloacid dehalogenase superfamily)
MVEPPDLIAFDIDETIVGPDLLLPDALIEAVTRMREGGTVFTLATGRMTRSAVRFARSLSINTEIICYQGAVTATPDGDVVRQKTIAGTLAGLIQNGIEESDGQVLAFRNDQIFSTSATPWADSYGERMGTPVNEVAAYEELWEEEPNLILIVNEPAAVGELVRRLQAVIGDRVMITHSRPNFCEIGPIGSGKDAALSDLARSLNLTREGVLAFGDGVGDAPMLRWAGVGVAPQTGHPEALAAADFVIEGAPGAGVADFLVSRYLS